MNKWLKKLPIKRHRIVAAFSEETSVIKVIIDVMPKHFPTLMRFKTHFCWEEIFFNCTDAQYKTIYARLKYGDIVLSSIAEVEKPDD